MAVNFATSVTYWAARGFPVVSEDKFKERIAVCQKCSYWKPDARAGLGKCNHKGCGCTKLKHWLATTHCPIQKW